MMKYRYLKTFFMVGCYLSSMGLFGFEEQYKNDNIEDRFDTLQFYYETGLLKRTRDPSHKDMEIIRRDCGALFGKHVEQARELVKNKKDYYIKFVDQDNQPLPNVAIRVTGGCDGDECDVKFDRSGYDGPFISDANGIVHLRKYSLELIVNFFESTDSREFNQHFYSRGYLNLKFRPVKFDENDDLVLDSYGTTEENPYIIKVVRKKNPSNPNVCDLFSLIHGSQYLFENWKNNKTRIILDGGSKKLGKDGQIYCKDWEKKCPIDLSVELGDWDNGLKDIGEDRRVFARDVKVTVTLKGGGFVRRTKRFDTMAPESGYQETLVFDFKTGTRDKESRRSYFVKYPNGMYGILNFDIYDLACFFDGPHGTVVGDRNLETETSYAGPSLIGYFEDDDQYPQFLDINELRMDNDPRYYTPVE